jgi:hypothetical protein
MKVKIINVPKYSYEYLVTNFKSKVLDDTIRDEYRLGIKKRLILFKKDNIVERAIFFNGYKSINLPLNWYSIID